MSLQFIFKCKSDHRDLHSFPTRRSSDLASGLLAHIMKSISPRSSMSPSSAPAGAWVRRNRFQDRKSTRLNSSHLGISYAVFCLKKKNVEEMYIDSSYKSVTL